uniref:SMB domain-containing protein n=1 Tax=Pseudonaja textilis TaxID=8673 RepID=A0A670YVX9_PSETE
RGIQILCCLMMLYHSFSPNLPTCCVGRCTEGYSRTPGCQCDSSCQQFQECCPDYEQVCLAGRSALSLFNILDNLETDDTISTDGIGKSDKPDRSTAVTETAITKSGQDESSPKRDNPEILFSITESIITHTIPNIKTNAPAIKITRTPTNSDYTTGHDEIYKSDITDQISAITKATFTPSNLKYKTNPDGIYINQNAETRTPFVEISTPMNSEDSTSPDGISKSDIPESASPVTETTMTSINSEAPINPERIDKNVDPDSTIAVMGTTISPSNLDYSTKPESIDKHDNPNNTTTVIITTFALTDQNGTPNPDDIITDVKPDKTMPFTGTTITTNQEDKTARDKDDYGDNLDRTTAVTEIAVTHTDPDNIINPDDMIRHDNLDKITDVIGTTITVTNPDITNNDKFNTVTKPTIAEINPMGTTRSDNRNIFLTGTTAVIKAMTMDQRSDMSIPEVNVKNKRPKETTINMDIIRKYIDISGKSPSPNSDAINGLETTATVAKTTIAQTDTQTTFSITTESKPLSNSPNFEGDDRPGSNTTKTTAIITESNLSLLSPNDNDKKRRADTITKITRTLTIETTTSPQINKPEHPDIITNKKINLVSDKGTTKENPTNKNTVTQVSTTSSTLSSTTNKITSYSCTWSTIVKPTTQRQVTCYSSPRDATISTTISPQMIINKTTTDVQPEKIATLLLYKGIFNFLIIYITVNYLLDVPEEMNLCNKKPVDGIVPLQNGSLAVFRDHYYWLLNGTSSPSPQPRKISEGWHIPSPIDTVFSRCNCDGKTFFFKGSQYWRFTNDVMDPGYPKLIVKGFGGLNGKIIGALSVAHYRSRPESVHFFKEGGNVQQYIYKQKPKKCKKKVVTVNYPVYKPKTLVLRQRRFGRAVQSRQIFRRIRIRQYPVIRITHHSTGVLQPEVKITSYWRGFPKEFNSAISVPNEENGDGYDYYAFAKDNYYNLDVGSRIARPVTTQTGQTVSNAWYKCPA